MSAPLVQKWGSDQLLWLTSGLLVTAYSVALAWASPRFGYDYEVEAMPIAWLVSGLVSAGLAFSIGLPRLIRRSVASTAHLAPFCLPLVIVAGLAARLLLFTSEPIIEDDYNRYLWDGAVTAAGHNPYHVSPLTVRTFDSQSDLGRLAGESGAILKRVNHPELTTIYPPVAQGAFALAHAIAPWSLASWRAMLLGFDLATLALILLLLRETGKSPLWSALYWWNPLVIKEVFNSAHMDAVVLPPLLLALLLAARNRTTMAAVSLAVATGVKLWPILLLPLVLRSRLVEPRRLVAPLLIFGGLLSVLSAPILLAGIDATSGIQAYVARWQTNSALFPVLEQVAKSLSGLPGLADVSPGLVARLVILLALGSMSVALATRPIGGTDDLLGRASAVVAALLLLAPAQFPWYAVWLAPFLAFRPWTGLLLLAATLPLYYLLFHFTARDQTATFETAVVWMIWVPVWVALASEAALQLARKASRGGAVHA